MSRMIDADALCLGKFVEVRTEWHQGWNDALDAATTQAPTIDAVEVVRCKDCLSCEAKFKRNGEVYFYRCNYFDIEIEPLDFCSYGKRRDKCLESES